MYIKFSYNGSWFFYGPWDEVRVNYGCRREDKKNLPTTFYEDSGNIGCCNEIFLNPSSETKEKSKREDMYALICGWDKNGEYKSIALCGCSAYILSAEGKTLERIKT